MSSPRLAKLSPPRKSNWLTRPRLEALIDEATQHGAVWIAAEPGAGKSTLAAAWASTRAGRLLWYRADDGDADPAVAFDYLTSLARSTRRAAKLPIYRGMEVEKLETFARKFFRSFFDAVPAGATLVVDDVHAAAGSDFDVLLAAAVREAPADAALLILSRRDPDGLLLEEIARGTIQILDSAALAFTAEEATGLLAHHVDAATARRLHAQTNGWAAGMLMLSQAANTNVRFNAKAGEWISAYFDRMLLAQVDETEHRTLTALSLLPETDPDSIADMGLDPTAPALLERLRRFHSFVVRLDRQPPTWRLHDLLRDALQRRFDSLGDAAWRQRMRLAAARVAEKRGLVRDAVQLMLDAHDQNAALALAERSGRALVRAQRLAEVDAITRALGESAVKDSLLLQLALGESAWQRDQAREAVAHFERAMELIGPSTPSSVALLISATALGAILNGWQDFAGTALWAERVSLHLPARHAIDDPNEGLRIDGVLIRAADMLLSDLAARKDIVARMLRALREPDPALNSEEALAAGEILIEHAAYFATDARLFRDVVDASAPWLSRPDVSPLAVASWLAAYAPNGRRWPTPAVKLPAETPLAGLDLALRIAREYGAHNRAFAAALFLGMLGVSDNDRAMAQKYLAVVRELCDANRPTQLVNLLSLETSVLALAGDWTNAATMAQRALDTAHERGFPQSERWSLFLTQQRVRIGAGDPMRAREALLREAPGFPAGMRRDFALILADVALAAHALHVHGAVPADLTRSIMERARELVWPGFATLLASIGARLCADALRMRIEPEFAVHVIRERHLPAPDPYEPHWPWPVRIRALGTLEVDIDGEPVAFGARVARKPLELLKLLIARGPALIDSTIVLDALWPDAEGPDARGAYDMAILRLRKLLGRDDALRVEGGRLGLDPACVWVDAFAFQHGAIDDYAGPLFGDDAVLPWWASARERLHQRFLRRTAERATALEHAGDSEQALALYEAALAQDSLAENLYRGAIRCHLAAGRPADALRVYRRCREQLSIVLGVSPSAPTIALVANVTAN